jgi:hypothetical protein
MQTGKATIFPVVMVDEPGGSYWKTFAQFVREHLLRLELISEVDMDFFRITDDVDEAVEWIAGFYRVFHSYRNVGGKLVIRLKKDIGAAAVEKLNEEFGDLVKEGRMELGDPFEAEANEAAIYHLPRLIFTPVRHSFGRYRQFVDAINAAG